MLNMTSKPRHPLQWPAATAPAQRPRRQRQANTQFHVQVSKFPARRVKFPARRVKFRLRPDSSFRLTVKFPAQAQVSGSSFEVSGSQSSFRLKLSSFRLTVKFPSFRLRRKFPAQAQVSGSHFSRVRSAVDCAVYAPTDRPTD